MKWELIIIPLITTVFTTIILYMKESKMKNKSTEREITEQKLKELYNKLFTYSLKYSDRLEKSFYIAQKGQFEMNGEYFPEEDTLMIQETEPWNKLIKEIREIIHEKVHLLEQDDLRNWHQIELIEVEEEFGKGYNVQKYKKLEMFLVNISLRYFELYKKYHGKKSID
ncbi:hypothetical protein [Peribacillus frigoritolerans]|uniref:hypothetical protein n=1 Tax=Peribacillus frigoritolerans TaxID=450367 RepID=UPI0021619345|nr:hypothetical protein [Peribacillus frigoritolerans]